MKNETFTRPIDGTQWERITRSQTKKEFEMGRALMLHPSNLAIAFNSNPMCVPYEIDTARIKDEITFESFVNHYQWNNCNSNEVGLYTRFFAPVNRNEVDRKGFDFVPLKIDVRDSNCRGITAFISRRDSWDGKDTLWRNTNFLKDRSWIGTLVEIVPNERYQSNEINSVLGIYKVPGYRYRVGIWFSLATKERIN